MSNSPPSLVGKRVKLKHNGRIGIVEEYFGNNYWFVVIDQTTYFYKRDMFEVIK